MLRLYLPYSSSPAAEEEGAAQVGTETRPSSGRHYYGWRGKDYVFVIGTVETVDALERLRAMLKGIPSPELVELDLDGIQSASIIRWRLSRDTLSLLPQLSPQPNTTLAYLINLATFLLQSSSSSLVVRPQLSCALHLYSLVTAIFARLTVHSLPLRCKLAQQIHQRHTWFLRTRPNLVHRIRTQGAGPDVNDRAEATQALLSLNNQQMIMYIDWILGILLGLTLIRCREAVSRWCLQIAQYFYQHTLTDHIEWLMGYPAGLKLNGNLTRFLGQLHIWLLTLWRLPLSNTIWSDDDQVSISLAPLMTTLGIFSALMGLSVGLAGIDDLVRLLLLPVTVCSRIASRLYFWEVSVMLSLWRLFRGRRWNPLRERLDYAAYDLDQLLLGTVLFCTLLFLFPTIAVYYMLFVVIEFGSGLPLLGLTLLRTIIDHLPAYELRQRQRIVTGLRCVLSGDGQEMLLLDHDHPSVGQIIEPLTRAMAHHLKRHFSPSRLAHLLRGRPYC